MGEIWGKLKRRYRRWRYRKARRVVAEFVDRFPDRCLICCYHGYGIREGFVKSGTPLPEHDCIEGRS